MAPPGEPKILKRVSYEIKNSTRAAYLHVSVENTIGAEITGMAIEEKSLLWEERRDNITINSSAKQDIFNIRIPIGKDNKSNLSMIESNTTISYRLGGKRFNLTNQILIDLSQAYDRLYPKPKEPINITKRNATKEGVEEGLLPAGLKKTHIYAGLAILVLLVFLISVSAIRKKKKEKPEDKKRGRKDQAEEINKEKSLPKKDEKRLRKLKDKEQELEAKIGSLLKDIEESPELIEEATRLETELEGISSEIRKIEREDSPNING